MAINADKGTPGALFIQLVNQLQGNRNRYDLLWNYYLGKHPLPEGDARATETYRRFQKKARSNFTGLVVESVRERLQVTGFRASESDSSEVDKESWRIWQANSLDADSDLVHLAALVCSEAYVIVGPNPDDKLTPIITPESATEVTAMFDPILRRKPMAAVKVWCDMMDGLHHARLLLPDGFVSLVGPPMSCNSQQLADPAGWTVEDEAPNEFGVVPVVRFVNRPILPNGQGLGEFEDVTDIQDRMNNTILDRLVISKMQAYRQRWAKGVSLSDQDGNPVEAFIPGVDMLWAVEDENAQFGDFQVTDIGTILSAIGDDIKDLAAITRTPPHYLMGQIVNASGDALKAAETGLVSKVGQRQMHFGESWEAVIRLAGTIAGRPAVPDSAEVVWRDAQNQSDTDLAAAAVQLQTAGVPWRQRMQSLGYTDQQITAMEIDRAADALLAPPAPPVGVSPSPMPGQQEPMPMTMPTRGPAR